MRRTRSVTANLVCGTSRTDLRASDAGRNWSPMPRSPPPNEDGPSFSKKYASNVNNIDGNTSRSGRDLLQTDSNVGGDHTDASFFDLLPRKLDRLRSSIQDDRGSSLPLHRAGAGSRSRRERQPFPLGEERERRGKNVAGRQRRSRPSSRGRGAGDGRANPFRLGADRFNPGRTSPPPPPRSPPASHRHARPIRPPSPNAAGAPPAPRSRRMTDADADAREVAAAGA